ncbi:hypothetical protein acdb102_00320 [Acidothermaceae bacterium B102]|nr:hypothetical protein acdb102_00320 [Acidothermaceae bacterium B102]
MTTPEAAPGECPIMARGLASGAFWGAPLGSLIMLVVFAVPPRQWVAGALAFGAIGAVIGGLVGLVSGLVLAVSEHPGPGSPAARTDRSRRRTGFVSGAVPFLLLALLTLPVPELLLFWLPVALVSGAAGARLAPWVLYGAARRAPSLHE